MTSKARQTHEMDELDRQGVKTCKRIPLKMTTKHSDEKHNESPISMILFFPF